MVGDTSYCKALCFRVIFCLLLAHLSSESCEKDALGLEKGFILDGQITSSSDLSSDTPAKNGRLNYTAGSSWCASRDSFPYLEIDLQSLHIICAVSTQGNSKADEWVKTYSLQSSTDGTTWTNYTARGQGGFKSFSGNFNRNTIVKHVLYHGMVGRYVRFVAGSKHGQACLRTEIFGAPRRDIKGNVALFKPTDQSSTFSTSFSSYAVDGGKGTNVQVCAHTGVLNTNPFWRVDLGRVEHVAQVRILSRGDCCADRLDGAEIRVGDSTAMGGATNHLCATVTRIPVKQEKQFFCKPIASGRYVSIRIAGHPKEVVICEVEVYSTYTHNLALNQPAEQVSSVHGGVASRAVDGDTRTNYASGTCMHTDYAKDAWWRVDLGAPVPVAEVVIVNRYCTPNMPCAAFMDSFQIKIGNNTSTNTSCGGTLSMVTGETKSFYCYPPIVGRYVSVVVPGVTKVLTICEVEVYSTPQTSNGVTACRANPVGISNSTVIHDKRFSASSSLGSSFLPSKGHLNGASAWIPSSTNNNNDYLQIDLGSVYFVCAVATQGNPSADDWTKTYKIETSLDNVNWQMYQENNVVKIFSGNSGRNSIVKSDVYNPLAVKFIRFYPVAFNSRKALRVEVYGSMQEVPGKPTVDVSSITASTALVTWHYTPGVDETPVKEFILQYQTHTFSRLPGGSSSKELTNLKPCTSYTVKIKASSVLGGGFWSDAKRFTTATATPSPPSDVKAGPADKRSITLFWQKPKISGDDVQMYTVIFKGTKAYYPDFTDSRIVKTKALNKEFTNLYPGTKYDFVVFATTRCGNGENSSMVTTHTLIAAPAAPKNPVGTQKIDTTGSSVNLTMWPADQDNGPISYYQVLVHRVEDWTAKISEWNNFGPDFYVSAQIPASAVNPSMTFVLGDGEDMGGFTNKKLSRGQKYNVYSRATTAKSKKRSTDEQFLTGAAKLLAQIDVKAGAQENAQCSGWSETILISVVANAALGILLGLSVVCNVYQLRRSKRVSKAGERYSRRERDVQDTGNHEPVITGGHPSEEPSVYMELQPVSMLTNREQVSTNLQNENTVSSQQTYQPLIRAEKGKGPPPAVEYENTGFQTRRQRKGDAGEEEYENA